MDNPDKFHKFDMVAYYIQNDNVSNLLIVQWLSWKQVVDWAAKKNLSKFEILTLPDIDKLKQIHIELVKD
jgi:hypothetical protein